jgi:hypothetical protein
LNPNDTMAIDINTEKTIYRLVFFGENPGELAKPYTSRDFASQAVTRTFPSISETLPMCLVLDDLQEQPQASATFLWCHHRRWMSRREACRRGRPSQPGLSLDVDVVPVETRPKLKAVHKIWPSQGVMRWGWNGGTDAVVVVVVMDSSASRQGVQTACKRTKSAASSCKQSEMSASRSIGRAAHRDGVRISLFGHPQVHGRG